MSQSNAHRQLVIATSLAILRRHPNTVIQADLQESPGDTVPPLIGGYRPDIIARSSGAQPNVIIAEAKTDRDIDKHHTLAQIGAFLDYLETVRPGFGTFILAVDGGAADLARTVLRFAGRERISPRLRVNLFDGLDFWALGQPGERQWRLF